jgi:superfamily II DNA or RNA helicase
MIIFLSVYFPYNDNMSDHNKTQSNDKIAIPSLKRFMNRQEFQEYLVLVKSIANFDPNTKKWYLSEKKISSINPNELRKIANWLKNYVGDEIFSVLGNYLSSNKSSVYAILKGNYLYIYDDLELYKDMLTYKIKTFDYIQGQYVENSVLLAWQNSNNFSTLRGLYWKLSSVVNLNIKPFANFHFADISLKNFEMRKYQIESIRNWINDINITGNGIIKAPTGSGKSVIAILSALEMLKNKKDAKIIYAVNSTTLLKQFQNFAKKEDLPFLLVSGEIDELQKGQNSDLIALSVSYYYSQKKQKKHEKLKELINNADLIIIDEAHHTPANMLKSLLLDSPNSIRLGLSATPLREDGRELEILGLLGKISYSIDYTELVKNNYLVPLQYIQFETMPSKVIKEEIQNINITKSYDVFSKTYSRLLRLFENSPYTNKQVIAKIKELNKYPALVIVRRISTAKKLSELMNQNGIIAEWVSSKSTLEERMEKIEALKNGKLQILISTSLADEGLDIPNLSLVVLLTQGKSRIKLVQRIGRVMRPAINKQKGYILDIVYPHDFFIRQGEKRYKFVSSEYNGIIEFK